MKKIGIEIQILDWLQKLHTPVLDQIMCSITHLGDAGAFWILLAAVLLLVPRTRKSGLIVAGALLMDVLFCNVLLKPIVARTRPFDVNTSIQLLVARPHDYSFPSGHTAASFTAAMALYLAGENKMWKPALVLAVLIAFSRLYLYVHYPTDILGGIITGCIAAYIGYRLEEGMLPRLKWKR